MLDYWQKFVNIYGKMHLVAKVIEGKKKEAEGRNLVIILITTRPIANVPSHRALAMFRGRNEGYFNYHSIQIRNLKKRLKRATVNNWSRNI